MTTELETRPLPSTNQTPLKVADMLSHALIVQQLLEHVLQGPSKDNPSGVHYGPPYPGSKKKMLLQPGAEKICMTFRLAPKAHVEDLSEPPLRYRYRTTCRLVTIHDQTFVGEAVAECSTDEEKYQWERALNDAHYDATLPSDRRIKYRKDGDDVREEKQVRTNPADKANTVLKMSFKRAFVSITKGATAASDLFDVDLDESDIEGLSTDPHKPEKPKEAKRKPAPILPYGTSKGKQINDPSVPIEDLQEFANGKRNQLKNGKISPKFVQSDTLLCEAIEAEIQARQAVQQPAQPADQREPMTDEEWTHFMLEAEGVNPDAYLNVKDEFKVKTAKAVKAEDRLKFYDRFQELTAKK